MAICIDCGLTCRDLSASKRCDSCEQSHAFHALVRALDNATPGELKAWARECAEYAGSFGTPASQRAIYARLSSLITAIG